MHLPEAPYFADIAHGPDTAAAHWTQTSDDVRIRVGHWPLDGAKGTVLIFPGRTEFIEKYGHVAMELAKRGLASVAIDWRGQGLADRLLENPMMGHVAHFTDYQKDVAAMIRTARQLNLPRPYFLLGHSMGGAIGLRATIEGLPVQAAAFTGPMWGIYIAPHIKPLAWLLSHAMPRIGRGHHLPPTMRIEHHIVADGFKGNLLTRDPAKFDIMRQQLTRHPELSLGGPSYVWLREALRETQHLAGRPSPNLPCVTFLGSNERIVDIPAVHKRMASWKQGELQIVENGEHEVMMDGDAISHPVFDAMTKLFLNPQKR